MTTTTQPTDYLLQPSSAVRQLEEMEIAMTDDVVRPSNGILTTTDPTASSIVWPLGDAAHYAWWQQGGAIAADGRSVDRSKIIVDGRDCGKDSLEDALRSDSCEILVAAKSFLVVPAHLEEELRQGLQQSFLV